MGRAPDASRGLGWSVGADVGGTKILAGLVGPDGQIAHRHRAPVAQVGDPESVAGALLGCIDACRAQAPAPVGSVGVGIAGQVEPTTGLVHHAPNLRWRDYPLGARLSEALGVPVSVANDVRTIALGEWRYGAGVGCENMLSLVIGTGIGGGAVVDGRLLEGAGHAAGEIGHSTLVAGGRACHCPARGCFEAYVSGWAIAERLEEATRGSPALAAALRANASGPHGASSPFALERSAAAGSPEAKRFLAQLSAEFSSGVVGLVNAFNPERVVAGGKIVEGFPEFVDAAQEAVRRQCQPPAARAEVVRSRLQEDAGILGAALLARERATDGASR